MGKIGALSKNEKQRDMRSIMERVFRLGTVLIESLIALMTEVKKVGLHPRQWAR